MWRSTRRATPPCTLTILVHCYLYYAYFFHTVISLSLTYLTFFADVKPEQLSSWAEDEDVEVDTELQAALARARRLRLAERAGPAAGPKVAVSSTLYFAEYKI